MDAVVVDAIGDGRADDTAAFASAASVIQKRGGGILRVPSGTYAVGGQTTGGLWALTPKPLIAISGCTLPLTIDLRGVRLITRPGLKYGSVDPSTKKPYTPQMPFTDPKYIASLGFMIDVQENAAVTILGPFEMDGNIGKQTIGGQWGDTGWQINHTGIRSYNNRYFAIRDGANIHHFGQDGLVVGWGGLTRANDLYPHSLEGVRCRYNGRLGLALVGCNHLDTDGCDFSYTGLDGPIRSNPAAGVDLEPEGSIVRNARFRSTRMAFNASQGLGSGFGSAEDITLDDCQVYWNGPGTWAMWPAIKRFKMNGGLVAGATIGMLDPETPRDRAEFRGVRFSTRSDDMPDGTAAWGPNQWTKWLGAYALFDGCVFDCGDGPLPWFYTGPNDIKDLDESKLAIIRNSYFSSSHGGKDWLQGQFEGLNIVTTSAGVLDTQYVRNHGTLVINGAQFAG